MQNIVVDMCEKFYNDRLRNDGALVLWKSDNNNLKMKNNVASAWGPVSGSSNLYLYRDTNGRCEKLDSR